MLRQFTLRRTAVLIGTFVLLSTTTARAALTPEQKCQRAKIDAWSALIGCRNDALAREVGGQSSNRERCDTRFANQMENANDLGSCRFLDPVAVTAGELIGFFAGACAGPCVDPVLGEIGGGPHWTSLTRNTDATQALYVLDLGTSFAADWAARSSAFAARGVRAAFQ